MKTRIIWLAALALLAALVISGTAFAEGEVPLPSRAEEQDAPPEPAAIVEETTPPTEPAPETPAEELPVVEEPAEAELVVEPVKEALPAAEEVPVLVETPVLVDAEGEPLVLATEEAAELLIAPDPYFTTGGGSSTYSFTTLDCNPDLVGNQPCSTVDCNLTIAGIQPCANPLAAAINYIDCNNKLPDDGHLHVQGATYTGNITIDYVAKPNLSSLTGLIGELGGGVYPTISGSLSLLNLTNGFELLNFNITGGTSILNSDGQFYIDNVSTALTMEDVDASGSVGHGIHIDHHKGNIIMHQVTSNNNTSGGNGLSIDNQLSGTVTIDQNSEFNNNDDYGTRITTVGNVTLNNVAANNNPNHTGIRIESPGTVTLNSVMANGNDSYGIDIYYNPTGSVVNMNGVVANNNGAGIFLRSKGATLKNIVTNENSSIGLTVDIVGGTALLENVVANCNGTYLCDDTHSIDGTIDEFGVQIYAYAPTTAAVTLKNVTAEGNEDGGIYSETFGSVTATNISTNGTPNGDGVYITTNGAVTITSLGAFGNNGNGLYVRTKGAITISGIYAGGNGLSGADLDNGLCTFDDVTERWTCLGSGAIQVKNASGQMNDLSNNQHFGLWAISKGAITVTNLIANNNGADGAFLTNRFGGSTAGITVNTLGAVRNNFSNNGANESYAPIDPVVDYYQSLRNGLSALSAGNISATNIDVWQNQNGGIGMFLSTRYATAARTVTLSNSNAGQNDLDGVVVFGRGNITLNNVSANDNHTEGGILVDNCLDRYDGSEDNICSSIGTVLLTNINTHNNNGFGLTALSKGTITLNGVNSSNNWDMGILLQNNFIGATAGVSLTNISANDNNNTGLSVTTNGSATLASINTHNNAKRNGGISTGQTVQDFFNQNHGPDQWWFEGVPGTTYNFLLKADALWDLNRADFDPWIELYDADDSETPLGVTITCEENNYCSFSFDPGDAPFSYLAAHKFYVKLGSTSNDGFYHLILNDSDPEDSTSYFWALGTGITAGGSITVRGINSSNNSLVGLGATVTTNGGITLSNLGINNNGSEGVYLTCGQDPLVFSDSGWGLGTITISGSNDISSNGWDGLIMATSGNVTLSNLGANWNGQPTRSNGISIRDDHAAKAVTLSGITAGDNGQWGLWFIATGNISLTTVDVWQNQNEGGIFLDNCVDILDGTIDGECIGTGTVRLTTVSSDNNQGKGIEIYSKGLITLSSVQANGNWQTGILAENDFTLATAGITLGSVRAESNGDNGILAWTHGALLMSNITANSNALTWSGIDNGSSVQNYYNEGKGPDHWWFEATDNVLITLKLWADGTNGFDWLNRWDFDPFLQVFDGDGNEITFDPVDITHEYSGTDWYETDFYQIVWTPGTGEGGMYYVEVSSDNKNSGFYRLSVDDSGLLNLVPRWVDGLSYRAGGSVSLSGTNNFVDNEQAGLIGWNSGNVTLANFFAWGNGCEGVYIDNTGGSGNILINGTNGAGGNGWEGLRVITDGTVSVSNLEANRNGQDGIRIVANTALKAVTLNNIVAMWNGLSGIDMRKDTDEDEGGTYGITTLNNVRAWFNAQDGAKVDTNGYRLNLLNSSFICNDGYGFVYWVHPTTPPMLPFVFSNINNIFLGNGSGNLAQK